MKTWKKIVIGLALVIIVAFGIFAYLSASGYFNDDILIPASLERITIKNANLNGFTLNLEVQSIHPSEYNFKVNSTFQEVLIKDINGSYVTSALLSDSVLDGQSKTISVHLNSTLDSGNYTATLVTDKGGSFVSPSFNVS
jgi:hypothetical protein